jgi:hypothetical protein
MTKIFRNLFKTILVIVVLIAFVIGCILPLKIAITWLSLPVKENDWRSRTSPLSQEVIKDICSNFDTGSSYSYCKTSGNVYAPDLFPLIKDTYLSKGPKTYDDVQSVLGKYQVDFEPPVTLRSGEVYFVSWYDLRGDGVTAIVFSFNGNGYIEEIEYHLGNFDE